MVGLRCNLAPLSENRLDPPHQKGDVLLSLLQSLLPDIPTNLVARLGIQEHEIAFSMTAILVLVALIQLFRGRSWVFLVLGGLVMAGVGFHMRSPFFGAEGTARMALTLVLLGIVSASFLVFFVALGREGRGLAYSRALRAVMLFGIGLTISLGIASAFDAFPYSRVTLAWFLNLSWWLNLALAIWVVIATAISYAGKRLRPGWDGEPSEYHYD